MADYEDIKLAEEVLEKLRKYCILPDEDAYVAVTLWIFHTHCIGAFDSTPRLAILSPEKQCGKTRLLEVIELLCSRSLRTVNITTASLFRLISQQQPTVLIDEADAIFGKKATAEQHEDLRSMINAGYRRNNLIYRCENFGRDVTGYETFAAMALASIDDLPDTVEDRSVILRMRRRAEGETVSPFRDRKARAELSPINERLQEWGARALTKDSDGQVAINIDPELPDGLVDRPADVWEPLIAVADHIGGDWGKLARSAAINMVNAQKSGDGSIGVQILLRIKALFEADPPATYKEPVQVKAGEWVDTRRDAIVDGKVHAKTLIKWLNVMEAAPWASWNSGDGLRQKDLGKYLKKYGIEGRQVKVNGENLTGYTRESFEDPWSRYARGDLKAVEQEL